VLFGSDQERSGGPGFRSDAVRIIVVDQPEVVCSAVAETAALAARLRQRYHAPGTRLGILIRCSLSGREADYEPFVGQVFAPLAPQDGSGTQSAFAPAL
jgi:hypothetical protein